MNAHWGGTVLPSLPTRGRNTTKSDKPWLGTGPGGVFFYPPPPAGATTPTMVACALVPVAVWAPALMLPHEVKHCPCPSKEPGCGTKCNRCSDLFQPTV